MAQDDNIDVYEGKLYSSDTVFVVIGNNYWTSDTLNVQNDTFPLDMGRDIVLTDIEWIQLRNYRSYQPDKSLSYFFEESMEEFLQREYVDIEWLKSHTPEEVLAHIEDKVIMFVDLNQKRDQNLVVFRVFRWAGDW